MEFIIKSAVTLALLYSLFYVILRKETFHRFNRCCLLFILLTSLVLPLVHISTSHPTAVNEAVMASTDYITTLPTIVVTPETKAPLITWNDVLAGIYWTGLCIMLLYLILQLVQTYLLIKGGLRHTDKFGNTVILKEGIKSPFSIFHYIVMSVEDYENQRQHILTHEQEHIRMHHSYDLLLLQVVKALQWFNPFVWFLENDLKALHEYQADEAVINQGIDAKQYQQLLVVKAVGNRLQPFANNLRRGSLKKRIIMMYQKKSNRWMMLKALFILPVTCFAIYAFATPEADAQVPQVKKTAVTQQKKVTSTPQKKAAVTPKPKVTNIQGKGTPSGEVKPEDKIFDVVEQNAQFEGGDEAVYKWIFQNLKYPQEAAKNGIQGRVIIQFVIEKDGTISEVKALRNPNKLLAEEAERIVRLTSGKWTPAKEKGEIVRSRFNIPINFRLNTPPVNNK
jgi:TonB family protein